MSQSSGVSPAIVIRLSGGIPILDQPIVLVAWPVHDGENQQESAFHDVSPAKNFV